MIFYAIQAVLIACRMLMASGQLIPDYCGPPRCNTVLEIQTLQIAQNRSFFYQCARNSDQIYAPLLRPCGAATVFGFYQQKCVFEFEWKDLCENGITTNTTPAPITTTTTTLPITTPVTTTTSELTTTTTTLLPITTTTTQELTTTTPAPPITTTTTTTTSELTTTTTTDLPITTTTTQELTTTTTAELTTTTTTDLPITTTTTQELTTTTTSELTTTTTTTPPPITTTTTQELTTTTTAELTTTTTTTPPPITTTTTQELTTTTTLELTTTTTTTPPPITTTTTQELTTTTTSELTTTTTPEQTTTTTVSPPLRICSRPLCNTALELVIQHPSEIVDAFYICNLTPDNTYEVVMLFCDFGSLFSFEQQACVAPEQWLNACDRSWAPTCQPVQCNTPLKFVVLHPAADREHYFQCILPGMEAEERTCEPGTWFGFRQQACVQPEQWINDCGWQ